MTGLQTIKEWAKSQACKGNKRKGDLFQNELADFLRANGWLVDVVQPARRLIMRRGRSVWITTKEDILGAFDMLAIRKDAGLVLLIQATTDRGLLSRKKRTIEALGLIGTIEGRSIIIWSRGLGTQKWEAWEMIGGIWSAFNPEERYTEAI